MHVQLYRIPGDFPHLRFVEMMLFYPNFHHKLWQATSEVCNQTYDYTYDHTRISLGPDFYYIYPENLNTKMH